MAEETLHYRRLSDALQRRILADRQANWVNPWRCDDAAALRRDMSKDRGTLWRPAFVRDTEKILHLPYYNRYADKTQVFSFYHNDDLTRRGLHVQLVSRIARNIGTMLGLNLDLIEAIALGHDIGHTPFGHAGERFLDEIYHRHTGRHFQHNLQSVYVLDRLFCRNLSLQTLDGILCHNGELAQREYRPGKCCTFAAFDEAVERCAQGGGAAGAALAPSTLEGCVVRVCDMIAYLGKDRQDARLARIVPEDYAYRPTKIGTVNATIINNLSVDIVENSYGKDCLLLSEEAFEGLRTAKEENYRVIYQDERVERDYQTQIRPMFEELYERLLADLRSGDTASFIYRHHLAFLEQNRRFYAGPPACEEDPNQVVCDYIASMTDDYFLALYRQLFPDSPRQITFHSYFE